MWINVNVVQLENAEKKNGKKYSSPGNEFLLNPVEVIGKVKKK